MGLGTLSSLLDREERIGVASMYEEREREREREGYSLEKWLRAEIFAKKLDISTRNPKKFVFPTNILPSHKP